MNFKQSFNMAIKSLLGSKMRSFLTMLGIIIGVASVIILVSLISGMAADMSASFESMGTNLISVSIRGRGGNITIDPDDMQELVDENSEVLAAVTPLVNIQSATVKYETENITTTCTGCNEFYPDIKNSETSLGRFITYLDVEKRQKVCVVGSYIVQELFGGASPLGEQIKINGSSFTVVGVLEEKADSEEGSDDDVVMIPYTTAARLSFMGRVSSYSFSAASTETVEDAMSAINKKMGEYFSSSDYYSVFSASQALDQVNEMMGTVTLVLVGVAAISLLVGGIGIMNIMLVSVTERTREIGIRKSLGAKRRDIMSQFVVEAATTSSAGGIIGIMLGLFSSYLVGSVLDMTVKPSMGAVIVAFSVSVAIGITFGYFPANKAAKMNPIDALRHD
ncbi:ABC transporter permease [Sedimentibacter saalensis]|uniref:Putative ABC transport system permease protein n=1 Tax=Sedimentibacter saalensis TaxID=130788 RepID=A0A562JBT3_9FIRM|nr:ABC transporter permease [Sedimentibacter saalensis]TWH80708.1 putative ABC transport system permease protein [Sedimentibacter saalensis]